MCSLMTLCSCSVRTKRARFIHWTFPDETSQSFTSRDREKGKKSIKRERVALLLFTFWRLERMSVRSFKISSCALSTFIDVSLSYTHTHMWSRQKTGFYGFSWKSQGLISNDTNMRMLRKHRTMKWNENEFRKSSINKKSCWKIYFKLMQMIIKKLFLLTLMFIS